MSTSKGTRTKQFGDFQTPASLAESLCELLVEEGISADAILEPTCGRGSFLLAAARHYPRARGRGLEINPEYVALSRHAIEEAGLGGRVEVHEADFFTVDVANQLSEQADELLIIGNPPWVTKAAMTRLGGVNLPLKENIKQLGGFECISGTSNFDVSEWIILKLLEAAQGRAATIAMLCKSGVARRIIEHADRQQLALRALGFWRVDAQKHFGAAVDAGFFVFRTDSRSERNECPHYRLGEAEVRGVFGVVGGELVADVERYQRWLGLVGHDALSWRSGIKHDCAKIMILEEISPGLYRNGLGEQLELESSYLYPLVRARALRRGELEASRHSLLVTQRFVGEPTEGIAARAPETWHYLQRHRRLFESRGSSIYKKGRAFSIFGVGPYSFAPWKVAISGLAKSLEFVLLGPRRDLPVMVDDTSYFLGFEEERLAHAVWTLLRGEPAKELLESGVFWDAKRPVTKRLLERLHIGELARWAREHHTESALDDSTLRDVEALAEGRTGAGV